MLNPAFLLFLSTLVPLGGQAETSSWHGDVSHAAIEALPSPQRVESEGATFLLGSFDSVEAWDSFASRVPEGEGGDGPWGGNGWLSSLDWRDQRIVFVAFEGATRILIPEGWKATESGGVLALSQQFSRRRDSAEGPCSIVLQVVDKIVGKAEYRWQSSAEDASFGSIDLH